MEKLKLSVIIPAYNDQDTIGKVVEAADKVAKKVASVYEIRVINDASQDATAPELQKLTKKYPHLVWSTHKTNAGYGGTIHELYKNAKYEWIFSCPGDSQIPPGELEKLIKYINGADMIIGQRVNRHDPAARLQQSRIYNTLLKLLYGLKITDVNSVRLMKSEIIKKINLDCTSAFVDAELVINAIRQGFKVIETPINHLARPVGNGAGGGSMRTILPTIIDMIAYKLRINN